MTKPIVTGLQRLLFSLYATVLVITQANGQTASPPAIIPPSPNAAAFARYGNIPVSPYTGVPNVEIPLYEVSFRDIKVPVTLSYHASGIRVADESSRVGLGWVLNAGGVITRNVVNKDDLKDLPEAYLYSAAPGIPQGTRYPPAALVQPGPLYTHYDMQGQSGVPINMDLTNYQDHDFEPDQFNYNFLGYSGKFVLNKSRDVVLEKQEKIKIKLSTDKNTWEVTTADGFIYKFLDFEFFIEDNAPAGYKEQKSAWYLSEIVSPSGTSVKFHYSTQTGQYVSSVGSYYERILSTAASCSGFPCKSRPSTATANSSKTYSNIALDSIAWPTGRITFLYTTDRQDVNNDKRITGIQILRKKNTQPHEEIVFNQEYFTSSSNGALSLTEFYTPFPDKAIKRLKLSGFLRRSLPVNATSPSEQYYFEYYEGDAFPPKNSFARDHWGYYNGRTGNTSLLPKFSTVVSGQGTLQDVMGVMGQEKNPSAQHMQLLSLKSIIYPTKGKTMFFYEPNDFDVAPGAPGTDSEPESYPITDSYLYNTGNKGVVQSSLVDLRDEYVNAQGYIVPVKVKAAFRTNMSVPCDQVTGSPNVYFEIVNEAGSSFGIITPSGTRCTPPEELGCITCLYGSMVFEYTGSFVLTPGKYYWKAFMGTSEAQIVDVSAQFTWMVDARKRPSGGGTSDGTIPKYNLAGGLRIQKIQEYDPENKKVINVRRYDYRYKTDVDSDGILETHSYGKRMVKPAYSYFDVSHESAVIPGYGTQTCLACLTLVRDSGHPQANYGNNSVGYDKVTEYFGVNGENGYTVYEYENVPADVKNYILPNHSVEAPIQPPMNNVVPNPGNGNLLKQTHYNSAGIAVMMTENSYQQDFNKIQYAVSPRKLSTDNQTDQGAFYWAVYPAVNSNFPYLKQTIVSQFSPTGTVTNAAKTEYAYGGPDHLMLTSETRHESDLHKTVTSYSYPIDYSVAQSSAAITSMKDKFMHKYPVQVTVTDVLPGGSSSNVKTREFTVYGLVNSKPVAVSKYFLDSKTSLPSPPSYIPASAFDTTLYKQVFSIDYNAAGNIKRVQRKFDMPIAYLWGHAESLPVAEIKNAVPEQCFYTSFEEDGDLSSDATGITARSGLRVKSSGNYTFPVAYAPVDANTVMSYWYWQNNQWNYSGVVPFARTINSPGTKLDEVRAYPKWARMSTYTHIPVLGTTSQTDEKGVTVSYEYDELGRLKLVRNQDRKILKAYSYTIKK